MQITTVQMLHSHLCGTQFEFQLHMAISHGWDQHIQTTISRITHNREQPTSHLSHFITQLQHANCLSWHQCHLQTVYFNQDHYHLLMLWYVYFSLLCFHWLHPVHLLLQHSQMSETMQHSNNCDHSQHSKRGTCLSPTDGTHKYSNSSEHVSYHWIPQFVMQILCNRYSHKIND
jgi:hypothetical protein